MFTYVWTQRTWKQILVAVKDWSVDCQKFILGTFLGCSPLYSLKQGLPGELINLASLASQACCSVSAFRQLEFQAGFLTRMALYEYKESKLWCSRQVTGPFPSEPSPHVRNHIQQGKTHSWKAILHQRRAPMPNITSILATRKGIIKEQQAGLDAVRDAGICTQDDQCGYLKITEIHQELRLGQARTSRRFPWRIRTLLHGSS